MSKTLIIGAGGVGNVVARKCAATDTFSEIHLASRTKSKCDQIIGKIKSKPAKAYQVDADNTRELVQLINSIRPEIVINVALPYQDLTIMDACLETGVNYLDTANYEPKDLAKFEYSWQWKYQDRFREQGLMALLGSGFDPGVTNVFTAYAKKHYFDEIHFLDIVDCNAGDHGKAFATNFNPEINIREITQKGRYWEKGGWHEIEPLSVNQDINYPEIGPKRSYLLYHEELESLVKNFPTLKRVRFWMTFSENYIKHLQVLENVGMTGITPIKYKGVEIVPLEFLKALLPDPASLSTGYSGQTSIGCMIQGVKDGQKRTYYVYNNCDHAKCHEECEAQAVSYTTGVPAMIGAKLMLEKVWQGAGVFNMEELDPDPFMQELSNNGLPWHEKLNPELPFEYY